MAIYPNRKKLLEQNIKAKNYRIGLSFVCAFSLILINSIFNLLKIFNSALLGVIGLSIYPICLFMIVYGIMLINNKPIRINKKTLLFFVLACISFFAVFHIFTTNTILDNSYGEFLRLTYTGKSSIGGILLSIIIFPIYAIMHKIGAYIFFALVTIIFLTLGIDSYYVNNSIIRSSELIEKLSNSTDLSDQSNSIKIENEIKNKNNNDIFIKDEIEENNNDVDNFIRTKDKDRVKKLLGLKKSDSDIDYSQTEIHSKKKLFDDNFESEQSQDKKVLDKDSKRPSKIIHTEDELDADPSPLLFDGRPQEKQMSESERRMRDFLRASRGETTKVKEAPSKQKFDLGQDVFNNGNFEYDAYNKNSEYDSTDDDINTFYNANMMGIGNNPYQQQMPQNNWNIPNFGMNNPAAFNTFPNMNQPQQNYNNPMQSQNIGGENNNQQSGYGPSMNGGGYTNYNNQSQSFIKQNPIESIKTDANNFTNQQSANQNANSYDYSNNTSSQNNNQLFDKDLSLKSYKDNQTQIISDYDNNNNVINSAINNAQKTFSNSKIPEKAQEVYNGNVKDTLVEPTNYQPQQLKMKEVDNKNLNQNKPKTHHEYVKPPLDLLSKYDATKEDKDDFTQKAEMLETTLASFAINAKVCSITKGPTFTRFEMQMPTGVPVKKVTNYVDDITMALRSHGKIRLEIPIPGKNAFGIEVPNSTRDKVGLRDILESFAFQNSKSVLTFGLGKDISGDCKVAKLEKMPHLLVAGATNSGKSVCLCALIISLIYKSSPEDVRLMLIDPKRVEFPFFNGLPHLITPNVITDLDKAINSLAWIVNEMERRFGLFSETRAKNITDYNAIKEVQNGTREKMPYIVVIVDELADLMNQAKKDIEDKILRIAAKSRAAGIHLVLATQRPSVNVITGVIKANLPSRIAFAVTAYQDSKTILDKAGAENLLGMGDMLYAPNDSPDALRLQGAFVTNEETEKIVEFVKEHNESEFDSAIEDAIANKKSGGFEIGDNSGDEFDSLMKDACRCAIMQGNPSISKLQRVLGIGYPRAGKIIDQMEKASFISNPDNKNVRTVFITQQEFEERFGEDL